MKKFRKARCPHCGKKLGFLQTWSIKTQGEFKCPKCGGFSDIELDPSTYGLSIFAIILSGLIYLIHMLSVKSLSLSSIFLAVLPYLAFYLLSVYLVRLRKPETGRRAPAQPRAAYAVPQNRYASRPRDPNIDKTIVVGNVSKYRR
ncbi:hydrogenase maturation nickel metallochaperone HypA [Caproiciproducens galactitolivorans]|uniref:Cxxc_20_cxxc protein n=1 Tax=Caproiciproducens galactitolivorans TaxID=642589 RepID=A0A4Z0XZJ7_9FIRM|nr:hypothetical protein [Caproiciproducens galactitolivorans]QEY35204.1 hydrogenase maturation nickel metallochaperone HypA [Caproiciproducens galactitolivorans]TGJ76894.1 hypothetical protein CAGA_09670 [Caproiciproducens galactitolivorans]